jgi:hypothetical protein
MFVLLYIKKNLYDYCFAECVPVLLLKEKVLQYVENIEISGKITMRK